MPPLDASRGREPGAPRWLALQAALCVLVVFAGLAANDALPLDSHEIFVAQTAREMSARGDWIVPYFNGEPRLNKPPLSYWAAGFAAWLAGDLPEVSAVHVRTVSLLAGLGLLLGMLSIGADLFDRETALLAGALLAGSAGLFTFVHDARPDMLYAAWTTGMLAGAARLARRMDARSAPTVMPACAMWLCFAAATLTKGPHLPLLALAGTAIALWRDHGSWRRVWAALRPLRGLFAVAACCAPWWWLVAQAETDTPIAASQLGGTLLTPSWSRLGNPYYFYRPLQLVLPWLPLAVLAGILALRGLRTRHFGFLVWPLLIAAIALSAGRQYRYFYLLPLLSLMTLAIAVPLVQALRAARVSRLAWRLACGLQALLVLACIGWVLRAMDAGSRTPVLLCLLAAGPLACALVRLLPSRGADRSAIGLGLVMAMVWPAAAFTGALWDRERYEGYVHAQLAGARLDPATPLVTYGISPTLYVYYANRRIAQVDTLAALPAMLARSPTATLGLIARDTELAQLAQDFAVEDLGRYRRGGGYDVLYRLRAR